jgi:hypothetical protein
MHTHARRFAFAIGLFAIALALGIGLTYGQDRGQRAIPGVDPKVRPDDPIISTWVFDASKSYINADGKSHGTPEGQSEIQSQFGGRPTGPLGGVGKWVISAERDGLRFQYYRGTSADATDLANTFFCTLDGKPYPDPNGPGRGEVGRYWRLHPLMIAREVRGKDGQPAEMVTLAISGDGKVLTVSRWLPATPNLFNMQVFNKVEK